MAKKDRLAQKASNAAAVDAQRAAENEAREAAQWERGSKGKGKGDDKEEKRLAALARKQEAAAALAAEEQALATTAKRNTAAAVAASLSKKQQRAVGPRSSASSIASSTSSTRAASPPPALLRGTDKVAERRAQQVEARQLTAERVAPAESFAASNIDDALQLLDATTSTAASIKQRAEVDRHPERRAKAAYCEYEERMMKVLRAENPTLRMTQLKELLWKQWQKAPENPFNQAHIQYNAMRAQEVDMVQQLVDETQDRLRLK